MKKLFSVLVALISFPIYGYATTADEYYHAGFTDYQAGKWGEAISYLEVAIQQNPNYWQAYQLLAFNYYRLNDIQKCIQNCDASLQINPNNSTLQGFVDKLKAQYIQAPVVDNPPINSPGIYPNAQPPSSTPPMPYSNTTSVPKNNNSAPMNKMDENNPLVPGSVAWNIGLASWLSSWEDYQDLIGPSLTTSGTPYGLELDLGLDLNLISPFSLGAQFQALDRAGVEFEVGTTQKVDWSTLAVGGAITPKFVFPMNENTNLISHLELGYYTLIGSIQASGTITGSQNLSASNFGGLIAEEIEFIFGKKTCALDIGLGYRFLKMSPITASGTYNGTSIAPHTILDVYGNNAYLDFSGFRLNTTLRFF